MKRIAAILAAACCVCIGAAWHGPPNVVDVSIQTGSQDFCAPNRLGKFSTNEAERIGNYGAPLKAGLHFDGVAIPQGATILSAKLVVQVAANHWGNAVSVRIKAADEDDPTCPTTLADSESRPRTAASVAWSTNWQMIEGAWPIEESPDFASVIQELVDRPGFGGDRVLIYIENDGSDPNSFDRFRSFEFGENAPRLVIEWQ